MATSAEHDSGCKRVTKDRAHRRMKRIDTSASQVTESFTTTQDQPVEIIKGFINNTGAQLQIVGVGYLTHYFTQPARVQEQGIDKLE
ncbi:UNVERIFIED_CONTAM: hypothetical protein FKN15_049413 [Acipenser sinensis]